MKNLTLIILTTLVLFSCTEKKKSETEPLEINRTEELQVKVDSLIVVNDSLAEVLAVENPKSNYWFDDLYDGKELLRNGIAKPADFIESSLRKKPELIPIKGVLGGTMRFGNIEPLGNKWVIAYFDDGHIEGRALYKYKLKKDGELEFEIMDSNIPE